MRYSRLPILFVLVISCAFPLAGQDSAALVNALVRKGILTHQEAEDIRAELISENAPISAATSQSPNLARLAIGGRVQYQYAHLATDISGSSADPAPVNHLFLRRVRVSFRATFKDGWSAHVNYDLGSANFDVAQIEKTFSPRLKLQAGYWKAPIGYEEYFTSSGELKAIERSPINRYFVESNNGRRLGAGKYRNGVWLLGNDGQYLSWDFAVTNAEAQGVTVNDALAQGSAGNNQLAYWGSVAFQRPFADSTGRLKLGATYGFLPDQGGRVVGTGSDLMVWSAYFDWRRENLSLIGEYFGSDNERGASATRDANSSGWSLMATVRLTSTLEPVLRYGTIDSDGRGVQLGDGIRSAASGGTHDKMHEWFLGTNWYLLGDETKHDVRLQAGYIFGESRDVPLTGAPAKATVRGVRSQLQLSF